MLNELVRGRKYRFALERATFLSVLHRLFAGGSGRAAERWREDYRTEGIEDLDLHHLYRAMAWHDMARSYSRRDLFSKRDLVFLDPTSLYFEGAARRLPKWLFHGPSGSAADDPRCSHRWRRPAGLHRDVARQS